MSVAARIWQSVGGEAAALDRLTETGPGHALPSAFDVTGLAAGTVGCATLAAARLAELRDGRARDVEVDRRHAAIAFRSERHVTVDGVPPPTPWDPASGYYPTADGGLVQLHCNFPHHRAGALAELGIDDPGDEQVAVAVAAAVADRGAQELEDALAARRMVASRLRTEAEWAAHPHGRAVADLPVLEIERIGDAPPQPLPGGPQALSGVRVVDLTRVIAGPVCGRTLAAHGADVLRVGAPHLPVIGPILADTNLGKRWTDLDLRTDEERDRFLGLVAGADVVVQGYRPGGLAALGLDAHDLAVVRPGLVYASLSAYSHVGPWADRRGYDSLVQTATGVGAAGAAAAGVAGTRPLPAQALDHGVGWLLAFGVMEALHRRATEGGSWLVRTSLVQVRAFLGSLGTVDALAVADPGPAEISDLLTETAGAGGTVGHVALPGRIDGRATSWARSGDPAPTAEAQRSFSGT